MNVVGGNTWLTNCIIPSWIDISSGAPPNTKLNCMRCMFTGTGDNYSAISMWRTGIVSIVECVFDNCEGYEDEPAIRISEPISLSVDLKMIGNVFKN
eukprot:174901_1